MLPTARPIIWAGVLAIGGPPGIGTSSAQAQVLGSAQAQALGPASSAPRFYIPAPVYRYPAQCNYIPAPVYSYPTRTFAYRPRRPDSDSVPAYSSSTQDNSQPNHSYSYYDQDGIEHDSRYPHWSHDSKRSYRPSGGDELSAHVGQLVGQRAPPRAP